MRSCVTCVLSTFFRSTLYALLSDLPPSTRESIASIAFDGTSATAMLVQRSTGAVLAPAKLYNESQEEAAVQRVKVLQAVQGRGLNSPRHEIRMHTLFSH